MPPQEDLPFTVELWTEGYQRLEETLARASDFLTAKGAFEAAMKCRAGAPIMLRYRARVVMRSQAESGGA
jgi:hypothetical protein